MKIQDIYKKFLTQTIFELEIFFLNGAEYHQKLIGTLIRVLVRHLRALSRRGGGLKDPELSKSILTEI